MSTPPWTTIVDAPSLSDALRWSTLGESRPPVILDCRHALADPAAGPARYRAGHIPGAQHAHVDRDLSAPIRPGTGRHPLPDVDDFIATCSAWGIDAGAQVVAYDEGGGPPWASRAWWLLRYYGHENVAVLDGGFAAWVADCRAVTTDVPSRIPRSFRGRPGAMPTVTTWDLTTRAPRCLIDARAGERYRGEQL